jgi:uncharacterized protein (UPF0305 family)
MKVYHCKSKKYSTFILDACGQFQTTVEEFKRTYGLHRIRNENALESMNDLIDSRMSLFKDKTRLDLKCNPMIDDLAVVFSEWISKQPGFQAVSGPEVMDWVPVEEYELPF